MFYVVFTFLFDFSSFFIYIYKLHHFHYWRESLSNGHTFCYCYHPLYCTILLPFRRKKWRKKGNSQRYRNVYISYSQIQIPTCKSQAYSQPWEWLSLMGEAVEVLPDPRGGCLQGYSSICAPPGMSEMRVQYWFISSPDVCQEKMIIKLI